MFHSFYSTVRMKLINLELMIKGTHCDKFTKINRSDESKLEMNKSIIKKSNIFVRKNSSFVTGNNCLIENSTIIIDRESDVIFGENCKIVDSKIFVTNQGTLLFGNDCLTKSEKPYFEADIEIKAGKAEFGKNSNVKGKILVNKGSLYMGDNSFLNHGSEIRCEDSITIGDYVLISYFVDIWDTNTHTLDWLGRKQEIDDGYPNTTHRKIDPDTQSVVIGNHVWIGKYTAILKGCKIGDKCIIGTRSVVTKSFPENCLICGNPAKFVKFV